ncbi:hypothetical protein K7I13_09795 [Brucepastera parasyntrophica]|uniref:hypothetical protein n=1 Tax=Brucepastera parasyntrophica TaxID=2880008 RepID=UPI002109366E|nr:hypothetical protein [Brucepastera parasyntrophica]ULQ58825.1 hypothetical protein K7I13_09795 [Brucepastera parasyntrophica]
MKKSILLFLSLFFLPLAVSAQTAVPDAVYRQVDDAFLASSPEVLTDVLSRYTKNAWYYRVESYVLKKARQLVLQNELDQARNVTLSVIDNNLDNQEAVELYQSIASAISRRDEIAKREAERAAIESFRQQAEETKIRQEASKTYKTVTNTTSGQRIYLDQNFNQQYRTVTWDFMIGLANINYLYDTNGHHFKYGLSANGSVYYHNDFLTFGGEIYGDAMVLTFLGSDDSFNWSASGVLTIAFNKVSKNIFLRAGYAVFGLDTTVNDTVEGRMFMSPVIGLGLHKVKLGESGQFKLAADYYPQHLLNDDINFAMGLEASITFVLTQLQNFNIHFQFGLRDTIIIHNSDGFRNDARLSVAFGVGNYE